MVYSPGCNRLGPPWLDRPFQVVVNRVLLPASSVSGLLLEPIEREARQTTVEPRLAVMPSVLAFGIRLAVEEPVLFSVNISRIALPLR